MNRIYSEKYFQTWFAFCLERICKPYMAQFVLIECLPPKCDSIIFDFGVWDFFLSLVDRDGHTHRHSNVRTFGLRDPQSGWLLCCDSKSYRFTPNTSCDVMSLPFLLVKSRVCQIEAGKTANVDAPFNILFYFIRKLHFMYLWIYRMCCCCCRCVDGVAVAFTHCVARVFFSLESNK